ncbi:uncharacterized protein LOC126831974 isoform X2 [Patella vulgata]|uniref:uncharacterized protein LOC126831974 isoform X2 n=1 Tax=Patella vulgata TaxID=6465 RepID=UPI0024A90D93|nr:uncharacterized protein LOC126831974 isoform X2 [Patella vulgata]
MDLEELDQLDNESDVWPLFLSRDGHDSKVEDLRHMSEEKSASKRTIAKLQRELARMKSERSQSEREPREGSIEMKEVERERMLRLEAEQRLRDTRLESDACRARLKALQEEFTRMEETVQSMLQYKTKIEQLKQEKTNLASTYESSIQKHRNHISKLERENIMLLNQVKKLESQLNTKSEGGSLDKSKLLMERLKILEAENSGLVLENEQQRQQYEKCLDEIANQVVQALLAQKSLREECTKLQGRVQDLELQNQQLRTMFQKRIRYASDSHLQKSSPHSSDSSKHSSIVGSMMPLHLSSYYYQPCQMTQHPGEITHENYLTGSLQSMNSDYSFDESFGQPQMSSPPPWLRDKLEEKLRETGYHQDGEQLTKIETEFPATNSSPKIKHINVFDRGYGSWGRTPPKPQRKGKAANRKSPRNSLQSMSPGANSVSTNQTFNNSTENSTESSSSGITNSTPQLSNIKMGSSHFLASRSNSNSPKPKQPFRSQYFYDYSDEDSDCRPMTKDVSSSSTVSLNELLDSSLEGADLPTDEDFYSDWSPSCLSPKPLPTDLSAMKTMQNFMFPSPMKNAGTTNSSIKQTSESSRKNSLSSQATSITSIPQLTAVSSTSLTTCSKTAVIPNKVDLALNSTSSQTSLSATPVSPSVTTTSQSHGNKQVVSIYGYTNGASPKPSRPDNLILVPREKTFILNSLSSSSSEENKTLSSSSPHSVSDKSVASQTVSPTRKVSPIEKRLSPKSKHYVEIQVKKPLDTKKKSAVESSNKSKVAAIVPTPRSPKKSPPPVPKKPARTNQNSAKPLEPKKISQKNNVDRSPSKKLQGIVNPIVNPIVNSVIMDPTNNNFPVLDIGFGPKWPAPETNIDSVRVERSGSRDDGYSTMSSDIQPEAMEKYNDAAISKKDGAPKGADVKHDPLSDPDSAMENSSHSTTELQNSTHSLSSQVSTSSGENLLSPGNKVREMRKVFEEDTQTIKSAKKTGQPVIQSPLSPKLKFFQATESRSLENLKAEKLEESPELTAKTSWNYHSFAETKYTQINRYSDNQIISLPLGEDHLLEDIPEDRELETIPHVSYSSYSRHLSSSPPPVEIKPRNRKRAGRQLKRALSESSFFFIKPKLPTLYDDFSDGSWNSGRVFERSVSVSEMDMIEWNTRHEPVVYKPRTSSILDINESSVNEQVKNIIKAYLMSKMSMTASTTDSESDGDLEASLMINREWLKKNGGYHLPSWQPREMLESLKKSSTPSPVSIKRFDSSNAEDWLLKFSKEEIESHLATANLNSSSLNTDEKQNPYTAYSDLSHFASSSDTSTIICDSSSPEKNADISGVKNLDSSPASSSFSNSGEGNSFVSEEGYTEDGLQSPSADQKKFHSEFYSLCLVESNRSLVSSSSHETDIHKLVAKDSVIVKDISVSSVKDREFDEITRQIQSLSKTVNDLHHSLSSLNSADSGSRDDLMDNHFTSKIGQSASRHSMDGYHWEEDDYYLTSCGGEVIIGSNSMLDHEDGSDWINEEVEANHSGEIKEEFYEIQVSGENCTQMSGYVYCDNHNDDPGLHDSSFDHQEMENRHSQSVNHLADPEHRANVLDSMFASGAESNDSLASDIGLDHMMCQRLVGKKARHEAVRCASMPRQTLDFSKFFIRFDQPEKEAVAAFNFLEDISTSTSESGSEQRLFNPEEDSSASYQAAGVYIVDNHVPRSRRGDKIRRRRKIEQTKLLKHKSVPSVSDKTKPGHSSTSKILHDSLNTSSESPEICASNLSLSDSCCESFSSSDQSINDLTML